MEKSKTVVGILEVLKRHEIDVTNIDLNVDGVVLNNVYNLEAILEEIRHNDEYSSIRGSVSMGNLFDSRYETNYLSYERLNHTFYLGGTVISYGSEDVQEIKLFVSNYNWIDIHIKYKNDGFASVVAVPKSKSQLES